MTTYKGYQFITSLGPGMTAVLIVAAIWTIIWKAIVLWKSARNGQSTWFAVLLVVNTLGILEIIYLLFFQKQVDSRR